MTTKEKLAKALREAGAPPSMILKAQRGFYDDFESPLEAPERALLEDAIRNGLGTIVAAVQRGDFDATDEEGWAWYRREGRYLHIA